MLRPLVLCLLLAGPLVAQPKPARDHAITVDDYATLAAITQFAVSPDGSQVAYCEGRWDKAEDNRKTDLLVVATDGKGTPRRLTGERANDRQPKWAADGKACSSWRTVSGPAKPRPLRRDHPGLARPLDGADPKPITWVAGGVAGYDYAPKADAVFYAIDTSATDEDSFTRCGRSTDREYGHGKRKTSEIHKLDLTTWRTEKVIGEGRYVREFIVTADGQRVGMITAPDDTVIRRGEARVDVWTRGREGGGVRRVVAEDRGLTVAVARTPRVEPGRQATCVLLDLRCLPGRDHHSHAARRNVDGRADEEKRKGADPRIRIAAEVE